MNCSLSKSIKVTVFVFNLLQGIQNAKSKQLNGFWILNIPLFLFLVGKLLEKALFRYFVPYVAR